VCCWCQDQQLLHLVLGTVQRQQAAAGRRAVPSRGLPSRHCSNLQAQHTTQINPPADLQAGSRSRGLSIACTEGLPAVSPAAFAIMLPFAHLAKHSPALCTRACCCLLLPSVPALCSLAHSAHHQEPDDYIRRPQEPAGVGHAAHACGAASVQHLQPDTHPRGHC
jgi:hypothetical protein